MTETVTPLNRVDAAIRASAPEVDESSGSTLFTWAGGGFALLTGLLTFFGIKEGVLARVVHDNPLAAMGILLFLGLGVLLAVVAPSIKMGAGAARAPLWFLLLVIVALMLATEWLSKDFADSPWSGQFNTAKITLTVVSVAVIFLLRFTSLRMPWSYAFAVLAVALVSAGLYIAAKTTILDSTTEGAITATASFGDAPPPGQVTVKVGGDAIYSTVYVKVDDGGASTFGSAQFSPDRGGKLDGSTAVLVPMSAAKVVVHTCQKQPSAQTDVPEGTDAAAPRPGFQDCTEWTDQVTLQVPRAAERVTASMTSATGAEVAYAVEGYDVLPGRTYRVVVSSTAPSATRSMSVVAAKADGTFSLTGTVKPVKGQTWTLAGVFCDSKAACRPPIELARYTLAK